VEALPQFHLGAIPRTDAGAGVPDGGGDDAAR
jgi:hypothetical protein